MHSKKIQGHRLPMENLDTLSIRPRLRGRVMSMKMSTFAMSWVGVYPRNQGLYIKV